MRIGKLVLSLVVFLTSLTLLGILSSTGLWLYVVVLGFLAVAILLSTKDSMVRLIAAVVVVLVITTAVYAGVLGPYLKTRREATILTAKEKKKIEEEKRKNEEETARPSLPETRQIEVAGIKIRLHTLEVKAQSGFQEFLSKKAVGANGEITIFVGPNEEVWGHYDDEGSILVWGVEFPNGWIYLLFPRSGDSWSWTYVKEIDYRPFCGIDGTSIGMLNEKFYWFQDLTWKGKTYVDFADYVRRNYVVGDGNPGLFSFLYKGNYYSYRAWDNVINAEFQKPENFEEVLWGVKKLPALIAKDNGSD